MSAMSGCVVAHLWGAMAQNAEYQKIIEVPARYDGLQGKRTAVLVDADMSVLYEYPDLVGKITSGMTARLGRDVPDIKMLPAGVVVAWQWRTAQWNAMPYGEICEALGVDRLVFIDVYEYRLNPPGNRYLWEGVCAANIGVVERDGFDPDSFIDTFGMTSAFPTVKGVSRSDASANQIEKGLLGDFIKNSAQLFHFHKKPKHPDKYQRTGDEDF
jgi:hypothetical protein